MGRGLFGETWKTTTENLNGEPVKVTRTDYPDGGHRTVVRESGGTVIQDGRIITETVVDKDGNVTEK